MESTSRYKRRTHCFLLEGGGPINGPFDCCRPRVQVIRINDFMGTFLFFLHVYSRHLLACHRAKRCLRYATIFPSRDNGLCFAGGIAYHGGRGAITILGVSCINLGPGVARVEFRLGVGG